MSVVLEFGYYSVADPNLELRGCCFVVLALLAILPSMTSFFTQVPPLDLSVTATNSSIFSVSHFLVGKLSQFNLKTCSSNHCSVS